MNAMSAIRGIVFLLASAIGVSPAGAASKGRHARPTAGAHRAKRHPAHRASHLRTRAVSRRLGRTRHSRAARVGPSIPTPGTPPSPPPSEPTIAAVPEPLGGAAPVDLPQGAQGGSLEESLLAIDRRIADMSAAVARAQTRLDELKTQVLQLPPQEAPARASGGAGGATMSAPSI